MGTKTFKASKFALGLAVFAAISFLFPNNSVITLLGEVLKIPALILVHIFSYVTPDTGIAENAAGAADMLKSLNGSTLGAWAIASGIMELAFAAANVWRRVCYSKRAKAVPVKRVAELRPSLPTRK